MKRFTHILLLSLISHTFSYAQLPQGRTTSTKIADVLAIQPAAEKNQFLDAMNELKGFTSDEIAILLSQLKPQSGGRNTEIEYLTNSYSFHVLKSGTEQDRLTFVQGLILSLGKIKDRDIKGYVLQLIQHSGKDEGVPELSKYLNDEYLAEKAGRALTTINSAKAKNALSAALKTSTNEKSAIAIITALGTLKSAEDEQEIINLLSKYTSIPFQKTALNALSEIGQKNSLATFEEKIKASNYTYSYIDEIGLALKYAQSLINNKHEDEAIKLASNIFNQPNIQQNYKTAALRILAKQNPNQYKKILLSGVQDGNALFRNTSLSLLNENWSKQNNKKLISLIPKSKPEVQQDILRNLSKNSTSADYSKIEKLATGKLTGESKIIALEALNAISADRAMSLLIKQLGSENADEVLVAKTLLQSSKSNDAINTINAELPKAQDNIKIQLLDVISNRNNETSAAVVLPILDHANPKVREAAFKALPTVSRQQNISVISEKLDNATNSTEITQLQNALIQAISTSNKYNTDVTTLVSTTASKNETIATKYLPVFSGIGGKESLTHVQKSLSSNNSTTRNAAIIALTRWNDSNALEYLFHLARAEQNNFDEIFKGIINQIGLSTKSPDQKTLYLKDAFEIAKTDAQKITVIKAFAQAPTYQSLVFVGDLINNPAFTKTATPIAMDLALDNELFGFKVNEILNNVLKNIGGSETSYLKEAVRKHLAKMPNEEGYVSIFNGKDLTGWKGLVENPLKRQKMSSKELTNAQVKADQIMRDGWAVENGALVFNGKGNNIATAKQYGNFEMLIDWKLDKDGKEGDAGVYLRGTPQVQIWDTSRVKVDAQVGSGGLYNNKVNPSKPLKVADNVLGEWNTFKIRMVDDKVTVYLNGELVTDNVVLENFWDSKQPIFPIEQIELQAHGTKVYYRDMFIKELPRKEIFELSEQEKKEGYKFLFNGTNLDEWIPSRGYSINDYGHLWVDPSSKYGGNLYTKEEFSDFIYKFEFKLTPGTNNGVGIRTPLEGDAAYLGYEIQVLDNTAEIYKNIKPYQFHGSVYGLVEAKNGYLKPVGEWNQEEIHVKGSRMKVILNGTVILDADIKEATKNGTLDGKNHPGLNRTSGHIAFLGHGTEVFFRNVRIKKL